MSEVIPPLWLVTGADDHRRRRFVQTVTSKRRSEGWTVQSLEGTDPEGVSRLLSSSGVLFGGYTLGVVSTPEKLPQALLKAHLSDPDPSVTLLLVFEGDKPPAVLSDVVPKSHTKSFPLPPFYKMEEYSCDYVKEELRGWGCRMEGALAVALVRKVGTDLGVLQFEIAKACLLTKAKGGLDVTPEVLRDTLAPLSECDGSAVLEALASRVEKRVALELRRYKDSKGGDPTLELCGRVLSPAFLRWFQAAHLSVSGVSAAAGAGRVGANPWYWEHKILPPARAWGVVGCKELLAVTARAQSAVFGGLLRPWTLLEAGLLHAVKGTL